jgi:hypothetical protein
MLFHFWYFPKKTHNRFINSSTIALDAGKPYTIGITLFDLQLGHILTRPNKKTPRIFPDAMTSLLLFALGINSILQYITSLKFRNKTLGSHYNITHIV